MTIVQKMDDLIEKLESNDPKFIEKLNKDFDEFQKKSDNKESTDLTEQLLNNIIQKEKELDSLHIKLRKYINSKNFSNKNVKQFINHLITYIEIPKCKRILKIFIKNDLFSLDINQNHPNLPTYFNFTLDNSNTFVSLNNKIVNFNSIDFVKIGDFTNNKGNTITPLSRKVYELKVTKNNNDIITNIDFEIY